MFDMLLVLLTVLGFQFQAYEDCTISLAAAPDSPIVRFVDSYNDLPDDVRFQTCS
jgi:hypothetical protein